MTTYLSSTIQYQCKSTMGNTAVLKPTFNSIHVQYLCGKTYLIEILNRLI